MSEHYSEEQVVATVTRLTRRQLVSFVKAEIVTPLQTSKGIAYRQVDIARIQLLCELSEDFELNEDALAVIISLIDQLHDSRTQLRAVLGVLDNQPRELRHSIGEALRLAQSLTPAKGRN